MNNGSKIRVYNLLRGLSQHHDVTLLSFADQPDVSLEVPEVREICSKVVIVPWKEFDPNTFRARLAILSLKPRSIVDTFSPEMAEAITKILNEQNYDLIIASQLQMAAYYRYFKNIPAIFEEFEIGLFHDRAFSLDGRIRIRHALTWFKLRRYLSQLLDSFQACTVTSKQERYLFVRNFSSHKSQVEVVPNCLDLSEYQDIKTKEKPNTLIFSGPFKYRVNYRAMLWFIREIFPLILEQVPDVQLIITGDHENLALPPSQNVTLTGYVNDIKSLIASCSISIAPLLSGGGTRLKILEAMALGTPVVATSKGAEGLDVISGENILLADSPADFANCVKSLLKNEGLRQELAKNARDRVQKSYDWEETLSDYEVLVQSVAR